MESSFIKGLTPDESYRLKHGMRVPISQRIQKKIDQGVIIEGEGTGENTYFLFNEKPPTWYRYTHNRRGQECIIRVDQVPIWVINEYSTLRESMKPDAYVENGFLVAKMFNGSTSSFAILTIDDTLHEYNIMSKEEFRKKHPDKLKFKKWEVTADSNYVNIGCKKIEKHELETFAEILKLAITYESSGEEVLRFLCAHADELDLDL